MARSLGRDLTSHTSASFAMRRSYERCLYPMETYLTSTEMVEKLGLIINEEATTMEQFPARSFERRRQPASGVDCGDPSSDDDEDDDDDDDKTGDDEMEDANDEKNPTRTMLKITNSPTKISTKTDGGRRRIRFGLEIDILQSFNLSVSIVKRVHV